MLSKVETHSYTQKTISSHDLSGQSIIYFGPEPWEGMWRNRHQLMSRFAQSNKVMYVDPVISLSKLRRGSYKWSVFGTLLKQKRVTKTEENVFVYHSLPYVPISGRFPLDIFSWWVWNYFFKKTMDSLGFVKPIIWLSRPNMTCFMGNFGEQLAIYHIVDEYLAYGDMSEEKKSKLKDKECRLLQKVDLAIVVSENLLKEKGRYNKNTVLVPNGVAYEAYRQAIKSNKLPPSDIWSLPHPVIGYTGLISDRLDFDIIEQIATQEMGWSIVLVGAMSSGCRADTYRLNKLKNIYFLGVKEISQVPFYVKEFDVCFIPYGKNEQVNNLSPLKLYDYMATGKPIVTSDFPVAQEYRDTIYIARERQDFIGLIRQALSENDVVKCKKRTETAKLNTWSHRVSQISHIINKRLARTGDQFIT